MPTPSELQTQGSRRSIFGNYNPRQAEPAPVAERGIPGSEPSEAQSGPLESPRSAPVDLASAGNAAGEKALARSFMCRYLAKAFEVPEAAGWDWLTNSETQSCLKASADAATTDARLRAAVARLLGAFESSGYLAFADAYVCSFGHTVRGNCPMNEIEYGDIKADPLFQPHRLADLGAFYGAFGLEAAADAAERIDHISIELEFLSVLTAKEAYAFESDDNARLDSIALLRDAQAKFLRDHLGRWTPAFSRRLARDAAGTSLGSLAELLGIFVETECGRFGVKPGSEDLLLRPVDDLAEKVCESCGIHALPPGASETGPKF